MVTSMLSTECAKPGSISCFGDTLTDSWLIGQASDSRHARSSTHSPSSPISPMLSATGIKAAGDMAPFSG